MLALIKSAKKQLYIQTQYMELPKRPETSAGVKVLVDAVQAKIAAGLDVRIIVSQWETADHVDYLERLQHAGFDISRMRIQTGVHNKGFIVDSTVVAVGSQNWSSEGVLQNRDATLIVHDPRAAQYFEQIFLHDWNTLARPAHTTTAAPETLRT
jgi:phosphatidylserine/phosphatidylglycerophosphate/cardiolipin synthase-like enzyme